jgi:hypothetical protein
LELLDIIEIVTFTCQFKGSGQSQQYLTLYLNFSRKFWKWSERNKQNLYMKLYGVRNEFPFKKNVFDYSFSTSMYWSSTLLFIHHSNFMNSTPHSFILKFIHLFLHDCLFFWIQMYLLSYSMTVFIDWTGSIKSFRNNWRFWKENETLWSTSDSHH